MLSYVTSIDIWRVTEKDHGASRTVHFGYYVFSDSLHEDIER